MSEPNLVKRSIFKQEKHRVIYDFGVQRRIDFFSEYEGIHKDTEKISESTIFTCDLEMPLLEVGDEFYIEELETTVSIKKRVRSSKENVCYYLEPEIIEDEESDRTKKVAEYAQNNFDELNELKDELHKLKRFKEKVEKSFWFKFIKFEKPKELNKF